jgi:AraC family transcriptional regulator of adaptative response/methylated-DNA-[protein]-cysteine methyltransferase
MFHVKHFENMADAERWQAVLDKDRRYDGAFVTGVHSTGIYCRPSCPARIPLRKNVTFYRDADEATTAGLRPCKRCAPHTQSAEEACVLAAIAAIREQGAMTLDELAALTGYSATHFQRLFKRSTGLSPAQYARALRQRNAHEALTKVHRVADAIAQAGYGRADQFYAETKGQMGMTASEWRKGGAGKRIHWAVLATSLGPILVAATDRGVCCLAFGEGEAFEALFSEVLAAVEQPGPGSAAIPLDVHGTAFQQRVWDALRRIPAGETRSYGELAAALGNPKASRAVGGANGANNVAVLIPCHRVIASDGTLGGYAYGLAIKAELLRREGA